MCDLQESNEMIGRFLHRQDSDTVCELVHPTSTEDYLQRALKTSVEILNSYNQTHVLHYGENAPGYNEMRNVYVDMRRDLENKIQLRHNREFIASMDGARIVR